MMLPTDDQLDQISHADLVALVKALIARVERLEEENRQLKAEVELLKQPPANSRNSSQPPSRDGQQATVAAAEIKQQVIASPAIKSDETSARVSGRNFWRWVFIGASAVYHRIAPRRNAAVIQELMGEAKAEVWVSDCFSAQLKAPARVFQLWLQHKLRDLQRVLDQRPGSLWAAEMQQLFREAIHLKNRFDRPEPQLTLTGFMRRVSEIENDLDELLKRRLAGPEERKLQNRFLLHREKLLQFLYYPTVPPTNNQSEQAFRTSVFHRKVTNGFRSDWGAKAYADLLSVITASKIKGQRVYETLVNLMGRPVLQFLDASFP